MINCNTELSTLIYQMNELLKNLIFATHAVIVKRFSTIATAFGYPFNSLKALEQVWDQVAVNNSLVLMSSTRLELCQEVQYNGVGWLILGRSLGLGARFGVYEILTDFYKVSDEDVGPLSPLAVSLAAGFSGSPAASASHGFDTAKSHSQCMVLPKPRMYQRRGFLKWQLPGKRFESWTGIHPADRNILFASFVVVGGYLFAIEVTRLDELRS
ncbi:hypothetical protein P3S67_025881 [Capsicum chacoense]